MCLLILLFVAFAASTPTPPTEDLLPRAKVPYPGPIPYADPKKGFPFSQFVTIEEKALGLNTSIEIMKDCLVAYGSDKFYDSWQGNYCGGMGWFKGSTQQNTISTYTCYQACASWIEGRGFADGASDFQCNLELRRERRCWMGYHQSWESLVPSLPPEGNLTIRAITEAAKSSSIPLLDSYDVAKRGSLSDTGK